MPHPHYRVRTLLIATTLAAVVVACSAPWLRGMSASQLIGIGGRMLFLVIGVFVGGQISRFLYRRIARTERAMEMGVAARCLKVRAEPIGWLLATSMLALAVFGEVSIGDLYPDARAGRSHLPFALLWVPWLSVGLVFGRCIESWIGSYQPVYLTPSWFISPWICYRWRSWGFEYGWRDRSAGMLFFVATRYYRLELSIPPEKVDEVDRMLNPLLNPSEKTPPVVPPPPAT